MQVLAEPGTVIVTSQVQRQIAGLFVAEERGSHELRGVPEPVTLFQLVRASGGGRRAGQRYLTPLVGREEEIAMLMRRWERARQGDGQLVVIVGDLGSANRGSLGNSMRGFATLSTLGSNGAVLSFCRTRRCTQSPNGAGSASAVPTSRRSGICWT